MWVPCTLATLTSIAGLLALTTSSAIAVREVGVFAALPAAFALLGVVLSLSTAREETTGHA